MLRRAPQGRNILAGAGSFTQDARGSNTWAACRESGLPLTTVRLVGERNTPRTSNEVPNSQRRQYNEGRERPIRAGYRITGMKGGCATEAGARGHSAPVINQSRVGTRTARWGRASAPAIKEERVENALQIQSAEGDRVRHIRHQAEPGDHSRCPVRSQQERRGREFRRSHAERLDDVHGEQPGRHRRIQTGSGVLHRPHSGRVSRLRFKSTSINSISNSLRSRKRQILASEAGATTPAHPTSLERQSIGCRTHGPFAMHTAVEVDQMVCCGEEQVAARRPHKSEVVGSSPTAATSSRTREPRTSPSSDPSPLSRAMTWSTSLPAVRIPRSGMRHALRNGYEAAGSNLPGGREGNCQIPQQRDSVGCGAPGTSLPAGAKAERRHLAAVKRSRENDPGAGTSTNRGVFARVNSGRELMGQPRTQARPARSYDKPPRRRRATSGRASAGDWMSPNQTLIRPAAAASSPGSQQFRRRAKLRGRPARIR